MKKALVLGVLAIFAISIANVNAQDRTNVQQKAKTTSVKKQDPTAKQAVKTAQPAQEKKVVNQRQALPKSKVKNEMGKAANGEKNVGNETQEVKFNNAASQKKAEPKVKEVQKAEKAPSAAVKNDSKKAAPINNSVPPTNKTKVAAGTPTTTATEK